MAELLTALCAHPAVADACVHTRTTASGRVVRIAVVLFAPGSTLDPMALRRDIAPVVDEDQLPARVVKAESLDESPALGGPRPVVTAPFVAPRNHVECCIADIWAELLGWEEVGVEDSLHELGADSLSTVEAVMQISDLLRPGDVDGLPFEIAAMNARTVTEYARLVGEVADDI